MPRAQVFNLNNVSINAAPPSFHVPNDTGLAIPNNHQSWTLEIDTGGTVPAGATFEFAVEYLRSGGWTDDVSAVFVTGPYIGKSGQSSTIRRLSSSIGSVDSGGNPIGEYPSRARVRIDQSGAWTLPNVNLALN